MITLNVKKECWYTVKIEVGCSDQVIREKYNFS